jgi:hypothetical protein
MGWLVVAAVYLATSVMAIVIAVSMPVTWPWLLGIASAVATLACIGEAWKGRCK